MLLVISTVRTMLKHSIEKICKKPAKSGMKEQAKDKEIIWK